MSKNHNAPPPPPSVATPQSPPPVEAAPAAPQAAPPPPADAQEKADEVSLPRFRVTYGEDVTIVAAPNALDAWAIYCDQKKNYPSPKKAKVEPLNE